MLELTHPPVTLTSTDTELVGKGQPGKARGCFDSPSITGMGEELGSAGGASRVFKGICLLEHLHPLLEGQISN